MKYLIIGGTGTVGSQVVRNLVDQGCDVRVMTRDEGKTRTLPDGVEGIVADLANPETLQPAFEGVGRMFFLVPVSPKETELGLTAVRTAKDANIERIAYMSVGLPPGSERIPHFRSKIPVERAVRESGIPYTILRPTNFYQNDLWVRDLIVLQGIYPMPIGGVGINRVDVRDIADAAVNSLTEPGHEGKIYELFGPDVFTGDEVARIYTRHLNKKVRYVGDDLDAWAEQARKMLPDWLVHDYRLMFEFFQQHGFIVEDNESAPLREVLRHEQRSFELFVAELVQLWQREFSEIR